MTLLGLEKSLKFNTLSMPDRVFCKIRFFAEEKLAHHLSGSELAKLTGNLRTFFLHEQICVLFLFLNFILRCYFCTSDALASHFPKCCCGKYEITLSTMAENLSKKRK